MAATYTRDPFPIADYDGTCPDCSASGFLQLAEETTRYWRGFDVVDGAFHVYDDTTTDDGDDTRIDCVACGHSWAIPTDTEIEYG